jgi:hypothetical protein
MHVFACSFKKRNVNKCNFMNTVQHNLIEFYYMYLLATRFGLADRLQASFTKLKMC